MSVYPRHAAVYLTLLEVDEKEYRYAGQSEDAHRRIVEQHESATYRASHPKFFYFLRERAACTFYLLPVSDSSLQTGPMFNILEQWVSLIFRALQFSELHSNFSLDTLRFVPSPELHKGVGLREPLAQGFAWNDFPMRGSIKYSPDTLKREWYEIKRNQTVTPRRETFLRGDIFDGSFWNAPGWYGNADYEFQIWSVKLRVGRSWIDRCGEGTISVWCDLKPQGETHPESIVRGFCLPSRYNDPARRLGIKISGVRNGDEKVGWCWLKMDGSAERSVPRLNRLVDWLDGLDTDVLRPRRWYPENTRLDRPKSGYTLHPLDTPAWQTLVQ